MTKSSDRKWYLPPPPGDALLLYDPISVAFASPIIGKHDVIHKTGST